MKNLVSIFKSPKVDDMYLYVRKSEGVSKVPQELLERFGRPVHTFDLLLKADKKLARVSAEKVLEAIDEKHFYLQLPEAKEDYLLDLYRDTSDRYKDQL